MRKYRLYVDEVGDSGLNRVNDPEHRYLSLTGIIAESDHVRRRIHPELESIKVRYFDSHPDEPAVLHRRKLVNATWPFQALKRMEIRAVFDAELIELLRDWDYQVITVCLDKRAFVLAGYGANHNPYHFCLTALTERFVDWLVRNQAHGDVMIEARRGNEDREVKRCFRSLCENGTETVAKERFWNALTSREIKPKTKEMNVSGLQIADLIAYPSRNEILIGHGLIDNSLGHHAARVVEILSDKYERREGIIRGKVMLP